MVCIFPSSFLNLFLMAVSGPSPLSVVVVVNMCIHVFATVLNSFGHLLKSRIVEPCGNSMLTV